EDFSGSVVVGNKINMYNTSDPLSTPDPSAAVNTAMDGQNYTRLLRNTTAWTMAEYVADMSGANAVFAAVHGGPASHDDGRLLYDAIKIFWLQSVSPDTNYYDVRLSQVGPETINGVNNLPPYNVSTKPALNFLHLLACRCGQSASLISATALHPAKNTYSGGLIEDQALLTYKVFVAMPDGEKHAQLVWPSLVAGKTVDQVRTEVETAVGAAGSKFRCWDTYPGPIRQMTIDDFAFEGDLKTRVKGVYTGTNVAAPFGWYRQL
ncbi:MAG: hypothetical protein ABL962_14490, partial [Fimbriimonadaceae bacterium]